MDENRRVSREELVRERKEAQKKIDEFDRMRTEDPYWQEPLKWTVVDYNKVPEKFLQNGVTVTEILGRKEWHLTLSDHCYICNSPSLKVTDANLEECIFENCGAVTIEEGSAVKCVFKNVDTVILDNTNVYDSFFRELHCDGDGSIIALEDSVISGSKFKDIRLENDSYLAEGIGDCLIEKCTFANVCTDREDGELFTCQDTVGKFIRKYRTYDMLDRDSCTGLETVSFSVKNEPENHCGEE